MMLIRKLGPSPFSVVLMDTRRVYFRNAPTAIIPDCSHSGVSNLVQRVGITVVAAAVVNPHAIKKLLPN